MNHSDAIIIVGAGVAGVYAAKGLHKEGYEGRIVLIDKDVEIPYDRPPLSKEWMMGKIGDAPVPLRKSAFYKEADIELRLGVEVVAIHPNEKTIETKTGENIPWTKLLLATGARLRTLDVPGKDLDGVFYLRTMSDARAIRSELKTAKDVVIVGAGFIGAEVASSLSKLGHNVTILEKLEHPMERIVGKEISEYFLDLHRKNGVQVITGDAVAEFCGEDKLSAIVTENGQKLPCQMAVVGIGVTPNMPVLHADLKTERGYVINEFGETSLQDVFAAGDCTSWPYHGTQIHVEHWENAFNQGGLIAKNMVHSHTAAYTATPYFWSDQYDKSFEYLGHTTEWSETVLRGSMDGKFAMFYLDRDQVVKAAFIVNGAVKRDDVEALIDTQKPVNAQQLADTNVTLLNTLAN
jgi:3-phenylpropionate/trans-cinnamate dioxygenase ferredoxin reductase component